MSVQVVYKNKVKTSNPGEIVLFSDEKFQIKNGKSIFSKSQIEYIEKTLKNTYTHLKLSIFHKINQCSCFDCVVFSWEWVHNFAHFLLCSIFLP